MIKVQTLLLTAILALAGACSSSTNNADKSTASTPASGDPAATATQCAAAEFVAAGTCYPTADAACAALACAGGAGDCILRETAPVQVACK